MPFASRICLTLTVLGLLANQTINAQEVINLGSVRVVFPTKDWVRSDPPAVLQRANQENADLKLLLYAQSAASKLRLHITQFEYPAAATEAQLAAFIESIKKRYEVGAVGPVSEENKVVGGISVIELGAHYRGWAFTRGRAYFCGQRVYLVEVGGASDSGLDATRCWDGVTLAGEKPLAAGSFAKIVELRKREAPKTLTSRARARAGYYALVLGIGAVAMLLMLAVAIHYAKIIRLRAAETSYWDTPDEA